MPFPEYCLSVLSLDPHRNLEVGSVVDTQSLDSTLSKYLIPVQTVARMNQTQPFQMTTQKTSVKRAAATWQVLCGHCYVAGSLRALLRGRFSAGTPQRQAAARLEMCHHLQRGAHVTTPTGFSSGQEGWSQEQKPHPYLLETRGTELQVFSHHKQQPLIPWQLLFLLPSQCMVVRDLLESRLLLLPEQQHTCLALR